MQQCDSHEAVWGDSKEIGEGKGCLIDAEFMQESVIQDKFIEIGVKLGIPKDEYKKKIEQQQGASPWIICDKCLSLLNFSESDKKLATEAAKKWLTDKNISGHTPKKTESYTGKQPKSFLIFGNGFKPNESAVNQIKQDWYNNTNKRLFGNIDISKVLTIPSGLMWNPANEFSETISNIQHSHKTEAIDVLQQVYMNAQPINNTAPTILICAVWSEKDTDEIKKIIKKESKLGIKIDYNKSDKKWWNFWK